MYALIKNFHLGLEIPMAVTDRRLAAPAQCRQFLVRDLEKSVRRQFR